MKLLIVILLGISLLLTSCQNQSSASTGTPVALPNTTVISTPKATDDKALANSRCPESGLPLSEIDFASYEYELN